jgi:hypothetical protein
MQRIRYFIHETSAEDYYNRLARQLFSDLTYDLFVGVDFSEKEKTFFMQEKHLMIPKEKTWKPLNILPGRFPIDKELCCKFILLGIDKFISSQNPIYAETLLYIWFAQATARWKRRGFEVNEIFTICPQQFRTIPITYKTFQANEHKVLLGNKKHFPISLSLKKIAFAYADTRSLERPIIKMHPSSIATCLKELAEELHLNPKTSPITLETFLEASHPIIGHRPGIKNSQKNTPSTT